MREKRGLRKGAAKIQFISCSERIAELRGIGLDIRAIYAQLVTEKRVTMTYTGFYENFTQRQQKRSRKNRTAIGNLQPALTPPTPETLQVIPQASVNTHRPAPARPIAPPQAMTPVEASSINPDDVDIRRASFQASIDQTVKEVYQGWNNYCPDPELQKETERIVGRKE